MERSLKDLADKLGMPAKIQGGLGDWQLIAETDDFDAIVDAEQTARTHILDTPSCWNAEVRRSGTKLLVEYYEM